MVILTDRQTGAGRQRDRRTDRQTDRQAQTDRQTDRQADRQTDVHYWAVVPLSVCSFSSTSMAVFEDVQITFVGDDLWVDEDAGNAQFCLDLSDFTQLLPVPVSAVITSQDGSATGTCV
jgi:hypothetical protein